MKQLKTCWLGNLHLVQFHSLRLDYVGGGESQLLSDSLNSGASR